MGAPGSLAFSGISGLEPEISDFTNKAINKPTHATDRPKTQTTKSPVDFVIAILKAVCRYPGMSVNLNQQLISDLKR